MTINFKFILKLVRQNLPIILVGTLVGLVLLLALSFMSTPLYSSSVRLFVSTPANALDLSSLSVGSSFAQQRVKSYADIINSPLTLNPVIQKLGLSISPHELAGSISASAPLDTVLIDVTVKTPDPILSANLANEVGAQFAVTASQLEFGDSTTGIKVTVVGDAQPSSRPSSPRYLLNSLAGMVIGGLVGFVISVIRVYFSGVVKNSEHLGGHTLLAAIAFDEDAVVHPLISEVDKYSARTEAFRQLRTNIMHIAERRESKGKSSKGYVLTVTSSLPGEGKTTSGLNLGLSLAAAGKKVLFLEGDLRRPSAKKYFPEFSDKNSQGFAFLLNAEHKTEMQYRKLIRIDRSTKMNLLLAGPVLSNAGELFMSEGLLKFLNFARQNYDFVIVDSPPLLPVSDSLAIAKLSDGILIIVKAGVTRVAQLAGVLNRIKSIGGDPIGVVLNMIPENARDYDDYGYQYEYSRYGYRGYRFKKYGGKYGDDYNYRPGGTYLPKTYPPLLVDRIRHSIEEKRQAE